MNHLISLNWLKFTPAAELQALLLSICAVSPAADALVSQSVDKTADLLAGQGQISDFKKETDEVMTRLDNWQENWQSIECNVEGVPRQVRRKSPLLMKLNALNTLVDMIKYVVTSLLLFFLSCLGTTRVHCLTLSIGHLPSFPLPPSHHSNLPCHSAIRYTLEVESTNYGHGDDVSSELGHQLVLVLQKMTDDERRTRIDDHLERRLDRILVSRSRRMYGERGRDVKSPPDVSESEEEAEGEVEEEQSGEDENGIGEWSLYIGETSSADEQEDDPY